MNRSYVKSSAGKFFFLKQIQLCGLYPILTKKIKFEAKIDMFNVYINKSLVWTLQFAESLNLYFFIYESMKKNPQK